MINVDEDALICDLAETYKVFDYRSLPCKMVATFSCGLGENSRIKMKLANAKITTQEMLLSAITDNTKMLAWLNSQDGANGVNRPESLLAILTGRVRENDIIAFGSGEAFKKEWRKRSRGE